MSHVTHYSAHIGAREDKYYKGTLFQGDYLMIGINCLGPGQTQPVHDHAAADKAYIVMQGRGHFTLGAEQHEAGPGEVVWAAAGAPHGVANRSDEPLVVLVAIAPPPG